MTAYQRSTKPLIDFYQQRGLLVTVAATGAPEEICERTLAALNGR
jgi:adenylate kinase family enzyme